MTEELKWIDWALDGKPVWNLGQIDTKTERGLNKLVKQGKLLKARAPWCFMSPLKTVWFLPGCAPVEVALSNHNHHTPGG